jgi:molecular chaperone DnaK (HSP70)
VIWQGGYVLGIDFGTSTTVAVLSGPDGRSRPLLFDASPLLASGVFVGGGTTLLTGADAERAALGSPGGYEANPKRRIDEGTVWLGEREVPVVDLVAAVLGRVAEEARRVVGGPPARVVITHPARWGPTRRGVLADAARRAALGEVTDLAFSPDGRTVAAAGADGKVLLYDVPAT